MKACLQAVYIATPVLLPKMKAQPLSVQAAWVVDCTEALWSFPLGLVSCAMLLPSQSWVQALERGEHAEGPLMLVRSLLWCHHMHLLTAVPPWLWLATHVF